MIRKLNDLITHVGPGTPAGQLLRHYWQPVALTEELLPDRPIKPVQLLGEEYVLLRDDRDRLGMLDRHCPHRGADLAFGRLENGGLRCAFHGWLFDVAGQCLETPAEPPETKFHCKVGQPAYPVVERGGVLFAYVGEGEPPAFPAFDCFTAPPTHTFAFKGLLECNWLQALEVGIDPAHASFLHRFFEDEEVSGSYGKQFRGASADSEMPITKVLREYARPQIEVMRTRYGLQLIALRSLSPEKTHVRATNVVFPQAFIIPMSSEMTISQWHVPIDDYRCYWYAIFTSFGQPVDKDAMRNQRLTLYELPEYKPRRNKNNNYGFDAGEQASQTYTGMGFDINVHDQWAVESQGPIQDRTKEHLGSTDKGIITYRRMLVKAIEANSENKPVPMVLSEEEAQSLTGPLAVDGVADCETWESYCRRADEERRRGSSWCSLPSAV